MKIIKNNYWLIGGGILLFLGGLFWFFKRRKINAEKKQIQPVEREGDFLSVKEILAPASLLIQAGDKTFYAALRQSIWNYFEFHFKLSGSEMSKENIVAKLKESKVDEGLTVAIRDILQQCEAGLFTNANLTADKTVLLDKAQKVLKKLKEFLL